MTSDAMTINASKVHVDVIDRSIVLAGKMKWTAVSFTNLAASLASPNIDPDMKKGFFTHLIQKRYTRHSSSQYFATTLDHLVR